MPVQMMVDVHIYDMVMMVSLAHDPMLLVSHLLQLLLLLNQLMMMMVLLMLLMMMLLVMVRDPSIIDELTMIWAYHYYCYCSRQQDQPRMIGYLLHLWVSMPPSSPSSIMMVRMTMSLMLMMVMMVTKVGRLKIEISDSHHCYDYCWCCDYCFVMVIQVMVTMILVILFWVLMLDYW
jgi:hypothetical protein